MYDMFSSFNEGTIKNSRRKRRLPHNKKSDVKSRLFPRQGTH